MQVDWAPVQQVVRIQVELEFFLIDLLLQHKYPRFPYKHLKGYEQDLLESVQVPDSQSPIPVLIGQRW